MAVYTIGLAQERERFCEYLHVHLTQGVVPVAVCEFCQRHRTTLHGGELGEETTTVLVDFICCPEPLGDVFVIVEQR